MKTLVLVVFSFFFASANTVIASTNNLEALNTPVVSREKHRSGVLPVLHPSYVLHLKQDQNLIRSFGLLPQQHRGAPTLIVVANMLNPAITYNYQGFT